MLLQTGRICLGFIYISVTIRFNSGYRAFCLFLNEEEMNEEIRFACGKITDHISRVDSYNVSPSSQNLLHIFTRCCTGTNVHIRIVVQKNHRFFLKSDANCYPFESKFATKNATDDSGFTTPVIVFSNQHQIHWYIILRRYMSWP